MKTVLKNKLQLAVVAIIIILAAVGYVLTQGSSFSKTNSILVKIEKEALEGDLNNDKAKELIEKFAVASEKAKLAAQEDDHEIYDFSALLQAHLTTIDVLIEKTQSPELIEVRKIVATRVVEIESSLVGREVSSFQVEDTINQLHGNIDEIVDQFKEAEGEIDSRMFAEAQSSVSQAVIALGEAKASIESDSAQEASRAALRARRLVKEAQYTVDLAFLIKEYLQE